MAPPLIKVNNDLYSHLIKITFRFLIWNVRSVIREVPLVFRITLFWGGEGVRRCKKQKIQLDIMIGRKKLNMELTHPIVYKFVL